ncbi:MAG: SpoIIIAC/SpoIIIAD family protein [Candidatus Pelethousia sp.]|nr:SpoIIIAC/SpoIIIAD family protein [Candidatus Pelethousia sp.]
MTAFKLAGIALLAVSAAVVLRAYRPEMALQLSVAACLFLLAYALSDIAAIRAAVDGVAGRFGLGAEQLKLVFKVIGISYVVQFAAEACRDAGESAIASKVELAGRVLIVAAALPALMAVLSLLSGLLQQTP